MTKIARRRSDQFGDLVGVLKLCAVDLDNRVAISEKDIRGGLNHVSLTRAGWSEKEHRAQRPSRVRHPRLEALIERTDCANGSILGVSLWPGFHLRTARRSSPSSWGQAPLKFFSDHCRSFQSRFLRPASHSLRFSTSPGCSVF